MFLTRSKRAQLSLKTSIVLLISLLYPIFISAPVAKAAGPGGVDSGLFLWLDASDPDNDGDSTNNGTNGWTNNSRTGSWRDKSGNGRNASVLSANNIDTPTYITSSNINAQPAFRFSRRGDADGQVFVVPNVDIRPQTKVDVTIFAVYRANWRTNESSGALYGVWGQDNGGWDRFAICCGYGDSTTGVVGLGPTQGGATVTGAGNGTRLLTVTYDGNVTGSTNSGYTDSSTVYFEGGFIQHFTDSTNYSDQQSNFRIGWDGDGSAFNGDIAEIIIYDRVLSNSEISLVSNSLADKYGIVLAPTVTTNAATSITQTTATLNGVINAHSDTTTSLTIKYSTTSSTVSAGNGTSATVSPTSVSGASNTNVSANISGLTSNTVYYFRISATNSKGTNNGEVLSFTTSNEAVVSSCSNVGSIRNGSFENGSADWSTTALDGAIEIWDHASITQNRTSTTRITAPSNAYSYDGVKIAEIAANNAGDGQNSKQGLYQDVSTINGSRIFWSYWHKHRAQNSTGAEADQVSSFRAGPRPPSGTRPAGSTWTSAEQADPFNGATLFTNVQDTVTVTSAWKQSSGTFVSDTTTVRFLFNNVTSPAAGYGNLIDDVRFTTYSACPISVRIIAGRTSNFVIRNNEQDSTNFLYYGPQATTVSALSGVATGLTASVTNQSNSSSTFSLTASTTGTYSANYQISYTFNSQTYTSTSTLSVTVLPEVTAKIPSLIPVDPGLLSKSLEGITFASASSIYVCIDQVNSSGTLISPATITFNQSTPLSGVSLISSSPLTDSATVTAMTSQISQIIIRSNSGMIGVGGNKYVRIRAASIDNTDGVARSCDSGITSQITLKILKSSKITRRIVNLENGRQRR